MKKIESLLSEPMRDAIHELKLLTVRSPVNHIRGGRRDLNSLLSGEVEMVHDYRRGMKMEYTYKATRVDITGLDFAWSVQRTAQDGMVQATVIVNAPYITEDGAIQLAIAQDKWTPPVKP